MTLIAEPVNHNSLCPGVLLDQKYRLDTLLGEGGMGLVWLATHVDLDRPVAVKTVRSEYASNPEIVERMLREARAVAQLRGEHVVRVLDVARLPSGAPYMVLEYLEGNDLYAELNARGPLPLTEAVELVLQACEGLAEAHALGIVHRDLKPENLYLAVQPDGRLVLKILDFGISKDNGAPRRPNLTMPSTVMGSPHYMAPEQMRGNTEADPRSDIWSLGAILYELLAGSPPFDAPDLGSLCTRVLEQDPVALRTLRPEIPAELERVVAKCLHKDPAQRYGSVDQLARELAPLGTADANARAERIARVFSNQTGVRPVIAHRPAAAPPRAPMPSTRDTLPSAPPGPPSFPPASLTLGGDDEIDIEQFTRPRRPVAALAGGFLTGAAGALLGLVLLLPEAAPPSVPALASGVRNVVQGLWHEGSAALTVARAAAAESNGSTSVTTATPARASAVLDLIPPPPDDATRTETSSVPAAASDRAADSTPPAPALASAKAPNSTAAPARPRATKPGTWRARKPAKPAGGAQLEAPTDEKPSADAVAAQASSTVLEPPASSTPYDEPSSDVAAPADHE